MEEQPAVPLVGGVTAFEAEGDDRGDEVDEQECAEVCEEFFEAGSGGGFGVIVAVDEIVNEARQEHQIDKGRDERQEHLEYKDVRQGEETHGLVPDECHLVFEDSLKNSE